MIVETTVIGFKQNSNASAIHGKQPPVADNNLANVVIQNNFICILIEIDYFDGYATVTSIYLWNT